MIQDIQPLHLENTYRHLRPRKSDRVFCFVKDRVLCRYDEKEKDLYLPTVRDFDADRPLIYLFTIGKTRFFLFQEDRPPFSGFDYLPVRVLNTLELKDNVSIFSFYSAYHLWKWYEQNRFCGRCGKRMEHDRHERAMRCPDCGNLVYPRINPAVIVAVTDHDRIILTRYRKGYGHNALIAGFTEFGETLEETVQREVMEEVGLKVKNIRYYRSQPWGIAADILAGFYCEVDGDTAIRLDRNELKYAEWTSREDIVLQPKEYSLTNEMMKRFKDGETEF